MKIIICSRKQNSGTKTRHTVHHDSYKLTVKIGLVQNLAFNDLLNDVLKSDQAQNFVERIAISFIVHLLHNGQMGFSC